MTTPKPKRREPSVPTHWQAHVSALLIHLIREVHAMNPGMGVVPANLALIDAYAQFATERRVPTKRRSRRG